MGLAKNDSVVVSSEDGRYIALSTGFIKNVTESVVDVVVDRWALCFESVHFCFCSVGICIYFGVTWNLKN